MSRHRSALLIIDMISAFDFIGARSLLKHAERIGPRLRALKDRAARAGTPVVYCNDNFGDWRADFHEIVERCLSDDRPGRALVESVAPTPDDFFILKPKHSAFYETALASLLDSLKVKRVILCGIAGDGCIHSTASDAHMREYEVIVASDATASQTPRRNAVALTHLQNACYANIVASSRIRFDR